MRRQIEETQEEDEEDIRPLTLPIVTKSKSKLRHQVEETQEEEEDIKPPSPTKSSRSDGQASVRSRSSISIRPRHEVYVEIPYCVTPFTKKKLDAAKRKGLDLPQPTHPPGSSQPNTQSSNEADRSKGTIVPDSQPQQKSSQSLPTKSQERVVELSVQRAKSHPHPFVDQLQRSLQGGPPKRFASAMPMVKSPERKVIAAQETQEESSSPVKPIDDVSLSSPPSISSISRLPRPSTSKDKPLRRVPAITPSKFRPFLPANIRDHDANADASVDDIEDSPLRPPRAGKKQVEPELLSFEGSSQIQTSGSVAVETSAIQDQTAPTQESERTDFSGNVIRERDWGKVGLKAATVDETKKKTSWTELMKIPAPPATDPLVNQSPVHEDPADMMKYINDDLVEPANDPFTEVQPAVSQFAIACHLNQLIQRDFR